ncbi:helix-turn-helix domain-containing protein [Microcoleus sp. FACHB-1515]|uniref:helix-turn-helix domain-containing protein n=1 Tax=Cyanophyceae TaxID=3028117 RepID=UPI001683EFA3|nr:helix-turn-helix transcriptional regulator [Microcoleus sp. FACHB-1515]MBD2091042.1 helix-turn-helix domain-containing protein [Microcoleus sp. FACHB-1515]
MTATTHSDLNSARSTQESLRVLFFQIEAELHRSDAFRQAMAGVQNQTGSSEGMQALLKAAGREAIRLAMRQMLRHAPKVEPVTAKREKREKRSEEPATESTLLNTAASIEPEPITPLVEPPVTTRPAPPPITPFEQQRQLAMQQLGETLREARYAKGLSIEQVHSQTWVPIHQLKALEAGQVEHLPEDIFVRGFIRRVGDTLGLDGCELADTLPSLDAAKSVVPSWARSRIAPSSAQGCLQPAHLYVGYAALMAGAVGSLAWITQHPVSPGLLEKIEPEPPAPEQQTKPGVRFSGVQRGAVAQAIAQPQMVTPESAGL